MSVEKLQDSSVKDSFNGSYVIRVAVVIIVALTISLGVIMFAGGDESVTGDEEFDLQYTDAGVLVTQTQGDPVGNVEVKFTYHNSPEETYSLDIESLNKQEIIVTEKEVYQIKNTKIVWTNDDKRTTLKTEILPEEHRAGNPEVNIDNVDLRVKESESLNGQDYVESDATIESYQWDILGREPVESDSILIEYDQKGTYTGELSVTDTVGNTATDTFQIEVGSPQLIGGFDLRSEADLGETVEFDASPYTTNEVTDYSWEIDGTTYRSQSVQHTFTSEGIKQVELSVTDAFGHSETVEDELIVSEGFQVDVNVEDKTDGKVILSANTGDKGTSFNWNFGDGETTTTATPNVIHEYQSSGQYVVTLSVRTEEGTNEVGNTEVSVDVGETQGTESDSQPSSVTIEMNAPTSNDWSVTNVVGDETEDVLPSDETGDYNPELRLQVGTRYTIEGLSSENPFELTDLFSDPVLSQEVGTTFEDSESINWVDNGSDVSFTMTDELAEWVDGYQSYSARENMSGNIVIVE